VHTLDVGLAAQVLEDGRWSLQEYPRAELPSRYGYVTSPQAGQA
jgi:hypothetical protein